MRRLAAIGSSVDVEAVHQHPAPVGRQDPGEHAQGGGLAGAVGTEQADDLARPHGDGHVVDGDHRTEALVEETGVEAGTGGWHADYNLTVVEHPEGLHRWPLISQEFVTFTRPSTSRSAATHPDRRSAPSIKARLAAMAGERVEIPLVIGGKCVRTGDLGRSVMPHDHGHVLADFHQARPEDVTAAIAAARDARAEWASWAWEDRAAVFLKAADLLTTSWRDTLNASTMLGQSKTVFQAEIDSACELIDFWRFNVAFAADLLAEQPVSTTAMWNQSDYRGLEGFVYAVSPFNFTAIGGNLTTTPALMGNTVIWKPAASAMLSAYYTLRLLEAAGLPPGVINFVPGDPVMITKVALDSPELAGIHFTGSTAVFQSMWKHVGANIGSYRSYPRLVGETGGKDFIVVHASADPQEVAVALVRGGFEYQGQKCSAASRIYVPQSLWPEVRDRAIAMMRDIAIGDPRDFRNFMGAVIDQKAFTKISGYIDHARQNARVLQGGGSRGEKGWFIEPTLVETVRSRVPAAVRGDLRPGRHRLRLSGRQVARDAGGGRPDLAVRADRLGLCPRSPRHPRGLGGAAPRCRQLLCQRQADRGHRRAAAVRRRPCVGNQRQGRIEDEPAALGERALDQGNLQPAARLHLSVHGRGVAAGRPWRCGAIVAERCSGG